MRPENENLPFVTRREPSANLHIINPKSFDKRTLDDIVKYQVLNHTLQEIIIVCHDKKVGLLLSADTLESIKYLPWKNQKRIVESIVSCMRTADRVIFRKSESLLLNGRICPN